MAPPHGSSLPTGQERIRLLYEEYIHLNWVTQVWEQPVTEKPELEPVVAAAIHGVELAFLLLADFINDTRKYVSKRPRVEAMALNIRAQVQLLADIVDGELEEEEEEEEEQDEQEEEKGQPGSASLTQAFPFEGCPPTTVSRAHSPGLARLIAAVDAARQRVSKAELNSLIKVSLQVTSAFQAAFQRWTVGLGIEHQLNLLLRTLGVDGAEVREHATNLDYNHMFRPQVVEATLTQETYVNAEDFFFRSVHLGTECWMFVACSRARSACLHAQQGHWDVASARVMQAARVLRYLGEHVLSLTRMNLRDYLELKVQLEGTSGAGSSLVRSIRGLLLRLMEPLSASATRIVTPHPDAIAPLLGDAIATTAAATTSASTSTSNTGHGQPPGPAGSGAGGEGGSGGLSPFVVPPSISKAKGEEAIDEVLLRGIMRVYVECDKYAGLYNYAKALEDVESALLGGFYHSHYVLATNVIGSEARGTMRRAVAALKATYERPLYPVLDAVRCALGVRFDTQLAHMKGRMMDDILSKYASAASGSNTDERQRSLIPPDVVRLGSFAARPASTPSPNQQPSPERAERARGGHNVDVDTNNLRRLAHAHAHSLNASGAASVSGGAEGGEAGGSGPEGQAMEEQSPSPGGGGGCPFFGSPLPPRSQEQEQAVVAAARAALMGRGPGGAGAGAGGGCPFSHAAASAGRGAGGDGSGGPATPEPGQVSSILPHQG